MHIGTGQHGDEVVAHRAASEYIEALDKGLAYLSLVLSEFPDLTVREQGKVLRVFIKKVTIDVEGSVLDVAFHPPFGYLTELAGKLRGNFDEEAWQAVYPPERLIEAWAFPHRKKAERIILRVT